MISFLFAILASQLLSTVVFAQSGGIKTIVAFGGSVNDNGNFFSQYAFPPAPYWQGRFSNGPVWVEQLATLLKNATLLDFASIGACANVSNAGVSTVPGTKVPAASVPDLWKQYESYQNDTRAKGVSLDTDLFTVFAGADDMLYAMGRGEVPDVVGIAGSVVKFVGALAKLGTKQILVANIPPLDLMPKFVKSNPENIKKLVAGYNAALAKGLQTVSASFPASKITLTDTNALYTYMSQTQRASGFFVNTYDACFDGKVACPNPDLYFFWDSIQCTSKALSFWAQYSWNQLNGVDGYFKAGTVAADQQLGLLKSGASLSSGLVKLGLVFAFALLL